MDNEIVYRRFDDLGRIVIPKQIRRQLGIDVGDAMQITIDKQGRVVLEKYTPND